MDDFFQKLRELSEDTPAIESVILVGSYARGTNTPESDIDIVIITSEKVKMLENPAFIDRFGKVCKKQTEYYGACTSIRAWYESGIEAEFGFVEPTWLAEPLDIGTRRVLADGYRVIADRAGHFSDLKL